MYTEFYVIKTLENARSSVLKEISEMIHRNERKYVRSNGGKYGTSKLKVGVNLLFLFPGQKEV